MLLVNLDLKWLETKIEENISFNKAGIDERKNELVAFEFSFQKQIIKGNIKFTDGYIGFFIWNQWLSKWNQSLNLLYSIHRLWSLIFLP